MWTQNPSGASTRRVGVVAQNSDESPTGVFVYSSSGYLCWRTGHHGVPHHTRLTFIKNKKVYDSDAMHTIVSNSDTKDLPVQGLDPSL